MKNDDNVASYHLPLPLDTPLLVYLLPVVLLPSFRPFTDSKVEDAVTFIRCLSIFSRPPKSQAFLNSFFFLI